MGSVWDGRVSVGQDMSVWGDERVSLPIAEQRALTAQEQQGLRSWGGSMAVELKSHQGDQDGRGGTWEREHKRRQEQGSQITGALQAG